MSSVVAAKKAKKSKADIVEASVRIIVQRREGMTWEAIAEDAGESILTVREWAKVAHAKMAEQTADELRLEIEDRLDHTLRQATVDLKFANSQAERTGLYRVILAVEAQRARLLGLNIPMGALDA